MMYDDLKCTFSCACVLRLTPGARGELVMKNVLSDRGNGQEQ